MEMSQSFKRGRYAALAFAVIFASALLLGCSDGDDGAPGSSAGTISGVVTNSITDTPVAGVDVSTSPAIQGVTITTDTSGTYSATLPIGNYSVTYSKTNFADQTASITLVATQTVTNDIALVPDAPVVVNAGSDVSGAVTGTDVALTATVEPLDGSTVQSILWEQSSSAPVQNINPPDALATTVTLGDLSAYRDELFSVLTEPPIDEEDLPPNVELPEGGFVGGLQDRYEVVGLTPFDLEEAGLVTMKVTVTTDSGIYTDEVEIHADLPWKATAGIRNISTGIPVLLHGGTQGGTQSAWGWSLTAPGSSSATLDDTTLQNPTFTPDVAGTYTLSEANSGATLDVIAGTWEGAISGQDGNGRPLAANCTFPGCHAPGSGIDQFTPWMETGHAEIFTDRLDNATFYLASCFPCHTVGYDLDAPNGGIDDATDYTDFLSAGLLGNPGDNWTFVLANFPATAQLGNIQCENCHGPQGSSAHMNVGPVEDDARLSLSSNVCGVCHGEPLRHGRFQQWQLSAHSNYELAIDEGDSGNCSRCHTANGFLAWGEQFSWGDTELPEPVSWTSDETHPQTCVTCHDPHAIGTTTGTGTDATTRIFDDTPELAAGWSASGVGNGAICMTCHNTRRGLYNDGAAAAGTITFSDGRAPHGGAQGDMVMGQNAFFVTIGARGPHSIIDDTCVNCHMQQTPPPDVLSYNQGGSNHTFFASIDICSECHTSINGDALHDAIEADMERLIDEIELVIADHMNAQLEPSLLTDITLWDSAQTPAVVAVIPSGSTVTIDNYGEFRGRQSMDVSDGTTTYENVQLRRVTLGSGLPFDSGDNLFASYEEGVVILKAGWNILMVENDGSHGIHNPPFANAILGAAGNVLSTTDFTTLTAIP